ncbi:MAG: hypothetical protein KAW51_09015 [Candidatus Lokiarchaeota archaeon]|nr:hypothetical protein [Candidatus Lokiarchaeota archaeon]MCK4481352.1 hypothetical protein [Candidatus Lokiarchaeota archaeon]
MGKKRYQNLNPDDNPYKIKQESSNITPLKTKTSKKSRYFSALNRFERKMRIILGTLISIGLVSLGVFLIWVSIMEFGINILMSILCIIGFIGGILLIITSIYVMIQAIFKTY